MSSADNLANSLDKMNSAWNGNLLATLKGDHHRIIPVKSGEIPPSG